MEQIKLNIASWNRFVPRNLSIHRDLVGSKHEYIFEGRQITIKLPSVRHLPSEPNQEGSLSFNCWREVNGNKIPKEYHVHSVDLEVSIAEVIALPSKVLEVPPCAYEVISEPQQKYLNDLANKHSSIAERAFDLWIRTLRWKCDYSAIGRPEISGCESGWSTYLVAKPQEKRVWIASSVDMVKGAKTVTPEMWEAAGDSLKVGCSPPVYIDLMMDAAEHIKLDDFQRATVDMAIACETFLRMLVAKNLPDNIQPSVASYIDDANIRQVLEKFVPEILGKSGKTDLGNIKSKLHSLFDTRNGIVHKGRTAQLSKELCDTYLEATRKLLSLDVGQQAVADGQAAAP
ncbi:hypothetical protein [Geobacter sp.]|uniref:hypothetical protein n=1 Tax=Geobacter sp. TaxID=46610 RepID=UPI0027BB13EB|nr:hypothetical protein [Geobacter sp.]